MVNSEAQKNTSEASPIFGLLDFCKGLAIIWIVLIHWRPEWFGWQGGGYLILEEIPGESEIARRSHAICTLCEGFPVVAAVGDF